MTLSDKRMFLSGNEALAIGAYESGVKVAAAYPGTPSSEILEYISQFKDVDSQWSVNEKVAFEVALGASIGGARALYASKHVGINVAMDPLMSAAYTGVNGGFVVVTCDDPGVHSSQNEQDNRIIARFAKIPLIEPSSPREAYEFVKEAFHISEKFDTPVLFRMTTRVSHTKEDVLVGERKGTPMMPFKVDIKKYVMVPANSYPKHIEVEKRLLRLKEYSETTGLNTVQINDEKIGFVTSSVSYLYAKEKYPEASFLKLGMSFPFPSEKALEFAKKVKRVIALEELEPYIENNLKLLGIKCEAKDPSFRIGELRPESIPLIVQGEKKEEKPRTGRKPVLCPGCSHRPVFWVLKKMKLAVMGDIGCYALAALPPLGSLHTCIAMGTGFTLLEGARRAGVKDVVGVLGDSTFVHSGITGLINAAHNKCMGVMIILDNLNTAMTGSQPHPGTGKTINNEDTKRLSLEAICKDSGADNVDVINPFDTKGLEGLIKKRLNEEKLSVIITRYPCRLVDRTIGKIPGFIKDKCKKCYACIGIDCPAVLKDDDGYISINAKLCTGCGLCVKVCPFGALEE